MLQYVPPPKKKERSTIFGVTALTRGPVTDDVNCQGRKKATVHHTARCL